MPLQLHPAVLQGLGWAPAVPPPELAPPVPAPPAPDAAGLPMPPQLEAPPVVEMPSVPPAPADLTAPLPSMAQPQPQPEPEPQQQSPEYRVPVSDVLPPPAEPQRPRAAPRPMSAEQQLAGAQQERHAADQASMSAIGAQEAVSRAKAADDLATYQRHDERAKQIEADRKAWNDEYTKTHAQKQAAVDAALKDADNYKLDQNKYWKETGVGTHVGWFVAMALSGIGDAISGKGGGPNPVIQMLQEKMHQSVVAQMDQREQLKQKAQRAEHALDKYDAFSQNRDARMNLLDARNDKMLANELMSAAAKYADPQAQATARAEAAKLMQSSAEKAQAAAQFAAGHDMQKRQLGATYAGLAQSDRHFQQNLAFQREKEENDLAKAVTAAKAKGDEKTAENLQKFGVAGVKNKDGSQFVAQGSPEGVQKLREKKAAATTLVGILDQALRLRTGYSSSASDREEWQRLQQLWGAAKAKGKDALGLGVLSGDDYKLLEAYLGSTDPTKFRDPSAGIRQARETVMRDLNDSLRSHGMDGEFTIVNTSNPPKPTATPDDQARTIALGSRSDAPSAMVSDRDIDWSPTKAPIRPSAEDVRIEREFPKMARSQRQILETWFSALQSEDPKVRDFAATSLTAAANKADEQGVRDYASELLQRNASNSMFEEVP